MINKIEQAFSDLHDDHFCKILTDTDFAFLYADEVRAEKDRYDPYSCAFDKPQGFQIMAVPFIPAYFLREDPMQIKNKFRNCLVFSAVAV